MALMQRRNVDSGGAESEPVHHFTFPAMMWFLLGLVFPPLFLCGCRYVSSANYKAKMFGWASLFMLGVYATIGIGLGAAFWRSDKWNGEDPACIQYVFGTTSFLSSTPGSAIAVYGISAPGLVTAANISLYTVNCSFVAQVVLDASASVVAGSVKPAYLPPKTLVVRVATPGTTGDNFGVYVRNIGARINPSTSSAPAQSWFTYASPYDSNPYPANDPKYGTRPPCVQGMCDGIYGPSLPAIQGAQYEARVPLGWYKYYMAIGVFADDSQALERPFCVDTCVLTHYLAPNGVTWIEPCVDQELTTCPQAAQCSIARTRAQCLGVFTRGGAGGAHQALLV